MCKPCAKLEHSLSGPCCKFYGKIYSKMMYKYYFFCCKFCCTSFFCKFSLVSSHTKGMQTRILVCKVQILVYKVCLSAFFVPSSLRPMETLTQLSPLHSAHPLSPYTTPTPSFDLLKPPLWISFLIPHK